MLDAQRRARREWTANLSVSNLDAALPARRAGASETISIPVVTVVLIAAAPLIELVLVLMLAPQLGMRVAVLIL